MWLLLLLLFMSHYLHYDVTGKISPNSYVRNNRLRTSWTWDEFMTRLNEYRKSGG